MCPQCYQHQLQESKGRLQVAEHAMSFILQITNTNRYQKYKTVEFGNQLQVAEHGSSKSQFYLAAEPAAYQSLTRLTGYRQPGARAPGDKSLHLANSTFYRDPGSSHQVSRLAVSSTEEEGKTDQLDKVGGLRAVELEARHCRTTGCAFFGSPDTNHLCSKCFSQPKGLPQASRV